MNREIKFRAWDAQLSEMYTPQFPYIGAGSGARDIAIMINGTVITPSSYDLDVFSALKPPVPELTLMQFTGLKDKNGVDVYEGDVVQVVRTGSNSNRVYTGVIEWRTEQAGWIIKCGKYIMEILSLAMEGDGIETRLSSAEVIGNIHQHPHLNL